MVYIGRDIQETTELLIKALIFATPESIKVSCGYILYWFLPSLISLTLLRYLSLYRPRLILLITIFFLVSDLVGFGFLNSLKVFGINIAIYIYPLGVFLNNILRGRWLNNGVKIYLVSLYLTLGFSYAALNDVVINVTSYEFLYKESVLGFLLTVALPVMFLYLLCGVAQYIKAGRVSPVAIVFSILGKNSLIIFLLHSLVLQFVYFVFGEYLNALESWSVFVYILIFLLSLSLPVLLGKLLEGKVSAFLFPKGIPNTLLKKWL
jgi:fucose 4-O-acetylase-like acetyltransferase